VVNGTTVARPANLAAGDLLLAQLEVDADPVTVSGPSGWTRLQDVVSAAGSSNAMHTQVWYKVAGSSEPSSYKWKVGGGAYTDIQILDYTGVDGKAPIDASAGAAAGLTSSPTTPAVTTRYANDRLVGFFVSYQYVTWSAGGGAISRSAARGPPP
jgi:hypothetical protein